MSNLPFDPERQLFPWNLPPLSPEPVKPLLADPIAAVQPKPATASLPDLIMQPQVKPPSLADVIIQPKRPRIFVSYQHSSDQYYYNLFSQTFHDAYETIYDNSLRDEIDSDDNDYIIQRIRDEFITGTSCTIVLVGPTSYQRKYIDWEIKATLDKEHGLIGIQLPHVPLQLNNTVIVPDRLHWNIQKGYADWLTWTQLIANPALLKQYVTSACARSKTLIVNPQEIKKQNA